MSKLTLKLIIDGEEKDIWEGKILDDTGISNYSFDKDKIVTINYRKGLFEETNIKKIFCDKMDKIYNLFIQTANTNYPNQDYEIITKVTKRD